MPVQVNSTLPEPSSAELESARMRGAEKKINATLQRTSAIWFATTLWIPFSSYLWTFYWLLEKRLIKFFFANAIDQIAKKLTREKINIDRINSLSRWTKVSIVIMNFFWFFAVAIFLSLAAVYICHGSGGILGKAEAFLARSTVRIATLNGISFEFCEQVPEVKF